MQSCVGQWLPSGIIPSAPPYIPINRAEIYCDRGGPCGGSGFFCFTSNPYRPVLIHINLFLCIEIRMVIITILVKLALEKKKGGSGSCRPHSRLAAFCWRC